MRQSPASQDDWRPLRYPQPLTPTLMPDSPYPPLHQSSDPYTVLRVLLDPWSTDMWRGFLGAIRLRPRSVDLVMQHGPLARLGELSRELETLTTRKENEVMGYLLATAAAFIDSLNPPAGDDTPVEIPAYTTLREGKTYSCSVQESTDSQGGADVAVITIREDEFKAMLERLPGYQQSSHFWKDYQCADISTINGTRLRVAVGRILDQGSLSAQALATAMILELKPKWILLVGIAGAIPAADYSLGDVLLSQRVHDFTVSAKASGKHATFQDHGGPLHQDVEDLLTQLPANLHLLGEWNLPEQMKMAVPEIQVPESAADPRLCGPDGAKQGAIRCLKSKFQSELRNTTPKFHIGPVIDASTLVMDPEVVDIWQNTASHACAIEMELAGVYRAARHFGKGATRVLAIRGFSDVVGFRRGPEWTQYACHSAASFAHALIRSGQLKMD